MSLAEPRHSICPHCRTTLGWGELVPLFSWLVQRGKCKHCGVKVSSRYFWVELITGSLWGAVWYQQLVVSLEPGAFLDSDVVAAVGFMLFSAAIVVAIFTDLAHYIIPDEVNAAMFIIGVGMNVAYMATGNDKAWMWGMPSSIAGALVGIGVLWGIAFLGRVAFGKDAMGHGDIKMARGIGAVLLPALAGISFVLAVALGAVFGIVIIALRPMLERKAEERKAAKEAEAAAARAQAVAEGEEVTEPVSVPVDEDEDEDYEPESIPSLLKSLVGYLLLMDIFGLFKPAIYKYWFGEDPTESESIDEDFEVEPTMIPFGPYLAVGALLAIFFSEPLMGLVINYWESVVGP